MKKKDVLKEYSQAELARMLGISQPSVHGWGDRVPLEQAIKLEIMTRKKLRVQWAMYQIPKLHISLA